MNAAASSAIAVSTWSSPSQAARWVWAKNAASQNTLPWEIMVASQRHRVSASAMSPASTAHSMPPEYANAPTG
jgi:hypothetical protein